jgi:hypothetical protein
MARSDPKTTAPKVEELHAPDFAQMKRIYEHDIRPAADKSAKHRGELGNAYKAIERDCHGDKAGAKLAFKLKGMADETRDAFLRTQYGLMKALGIGISQDLVDKMSGEDAPTMPTVDKSGGMGADNLATIGQQREEDAAAFDNDQVETQPAA